MLLDADKEWIVGANKLGDIDIRKMTLKPLEYNGKTVGYLAIVPMVELSEAGDILYVERQTRIFGMIALGMILVSVLLAIPLVYQLLVPVKAMIKGAEKLASGDYSVRIPITTGDELASLSEHFNLLAATLERNEKSRRRYMADVSHDLRTPLAILLGEIEAVQDGVRDVESTLPVLHSEVRHLNRLVGDLYDLSLSDIGALSYRKHRIDPVVALEQAVERYAPRMSDRSISLTSSLPREGTLAVNADPNRLQQLFTNLLENSLRYTDPGGRVEVGMHPVGRKLQMSFSDSSPGVTREQRTKLFARFYRVDNSRNRTRGGSGLGLAICWNIVDAHQGSIEAKPSPLGGLLVEVTLPLSG
jgi:two-component system sensor histidine kinase BaeS